uniref:Secreted protein n=1 Tax=Anolis carolinensis TaxID=28377 RepID=A0A803TZG0_ANOCA
MYNTETSLCLSVCLGCCVSFGLCGHVPEAFSPDVSPTSMAGILTLSVCLSVRPQDVSGSHFFSFEFSKAKPLPVKAKATLPGLALRPCLYKRR